MGNGRNAKKKKKKNHSIQDHDIIVTPEECFAMLKETSEVIVTENTIRLSAMGSSACESEALADNVEFWKWMNRNYEKSGHFASPNNMHTYINESQGQQNWARKVVQGKGYEWDWMSSQRKSFRNLFKTYDAGDIANRPGSDVTVHDLITGVDNGQHAVFKRNGSKLHNRIRRKPAARRSDLLRRA